MKLWPQGPRAKIRKPAPARPMRFSGTTPGKTGRSYRCSLDLWLGEVLHIKGIPIPYGAPNGRLTSSGSWEA